MEVPQKKPNRRSFLNKIGPGLITGAADDDPSGIVTYSQAGAAYGFGLLWVSLYILPFVVSIQELSARIGAATGKGISAVIKERYSRKVLFLVVFLLLFANTINLGADIGAMAAVAKLFIDLPFAVFALIFAFVTIVLQIYVSYRNYAKFLKWLTISLFAYVLTGFLVAGNWSEIFKHSLIPYLENNFSFVFLLVGVIGTTISPYLFFWQAAEEVEERRDRKISHISNNYIKNMRIDIFLGMIFSQIAAWFIIIVGGVVLNQNGINDIESADQAAKALLPLVQSFPNAGTIAQILFAAGIIGTGMLALPIFAASSSFAISEIYGWKEGLEKKFNKAKGFYGLIILGTVIGTFINFIGINPIDMLIYTAVINGIIAVPIIYFLIKIGNNSEIMGEFKSGKLSNFFTTLTFLIMACGALVIIYSLFK